jgi:hypothetical protein
LVGHFWQPYVGQAVDSELDVVELIGGAQQWAAAQQEMSMWLRKSGESKIVVSTLKSVSHATAAPLLNVT